MVRTFMAPGTGFWKRPTSRTYAYNLDLGEHYYHPMTTYLVSELSMRALMCKQINSKHIVPHAAHSTVLQPRKKIIPSSFRDALLHFAFVLFGLFPPFFSVGCARLPLLIEPRVSSPPATNQLLPPLSFECLAAAQMTWPLSSDLFFNNGTVIRSSAVCRC